MILQLLFIQKLRINEDETQKIAKYISLYLTCKYAKTIIIKYKTILHSLNVMYLLLITVCQIVLKLKLITHFRLL